MRQNPQERRLAEAVAALAATITEVINERLRELSAAATETPPAVVERAAEPFITMAELLERVRVSRRTMYVWMQKGYVPYIRVGRSLRFDWKLVNERLSARFGRGPGLSLY
jgi:excisionase family DNA binding protein